MSSLLSVIHMPRPAHRAVGYVAFTVILITQHPLRKALAVPYSSHVEHSERHLIQVLCKGDFMKLTSPPPPPGA
jgi:hypothetical protein